MEEKIFKSSLFIIIITMIVKTLIISIPSFLMAAILVDILPTILGFNLFKKIFYYFGNWENLELTIVLFAFIYSIGYSIINKMEVKLDGKYLIYIKNNKRQIIDIYNSQILFREKIENATLIGKLSSNYTIQIVNNNGFNNEICCYCFSKKDYNSLKKSIKNKYKEEKYDNCRL